MGVEETSKFTMEFHGRSALLYANGCRSMEEFSKGVKPFVDAYIFTTSAGCKDFDFDRVKARYANHYELYKAFKTSIGDQRIYFRSGSIAFFIVYNLLP